MKSRENPPRGRVLTTFKNDPNMAYEILLSLLCLMSYMSYDILVPDLQKKRLKSGTEDDVVYPS